MNSNVISTDLAINHINSKIIETNVQLFKQNFSNINLPICCTLIGGKSRNYIFDIKALEDLTVNSDGPNLDEDTDTVEREVEEIKLDYSNSNINLELNEIVID